MLVTPHLIPSKRFFTPYSLPATHEIDELIIAYIPILLGEGIPLFSTLDAEQRLDHVDTTVTKSGIVQSVYKVVKT